MALLDSAADKTVKGLDMIADEFRELTIPRLEEAAKAIIDRFFDRLEALAFVRRKQE